MTTTGSLLTHFVHLLSLKFSYKAKKMTKRELCQGKHLTASGQSFQSPLLLCVPIEIDILGHSCDVVKLGNLLKIASIHLPSSVLISRDSAKLLLALLVKNLQAREAEVSTLPWTQTEKYIALARCRSGQRAWRNKKPVLSLSAVTDEEGHTLENEDESGRRLCECWGTIFQAREEGPKPHQRADILRYVQHPPDDISWTIDQAECDELLALKKDSAPGPAGIPYRVYRCAGGLGSKFLFHAYKAVLEEVLFLIILPKVGPSLSLRHLILMTLEGLFDLLTHFAR